MAWELISLKSHPHRSGGEDVMVVVRKSMRRAERDGGKSIQYVVELCPFPLAVKTGNDKRLMTVEPAHFRVTADLVAQTLFFDLGSADAVLPSPIRGGGLGSLAVSELLNWSKSHYPDFKVVDGKVSAGILNYPNAEANVVKFLKNFGFAVARGQGSGLLFEAKNNLAQLQTHINTAKIDQANPIQWGSALVQDNIKLATQLLEQSKEISDLKEQVHQVTQVKQSPVPFMGGLLAGCVAGAAIAAFLFAI